MKNYYFLVALTCTYILDKPFQYWWPREGINFGVNESGQDIKHIFIVKCIKQVTQYQRIGKLEFLFGGRGCQMETLSPSEFSYQEYRKILWNSCKSGVEI